MEKIARFGFSVNFAPSDKKFVDKFYVLIISFTKFYTSLLQYKRLRVTISKY